jgi:hypothetical protein
MSSILLKTGQVITNRKSTKLNFFSLKKGLSDTEIENFVRYFYHVRGRFNQLLFVFEIPYLRK